MTFSLMRVFACPDINKANSLPFKVFPRLVNMLIAKVGFEAITFKNILTKMRRVKGAKTRDPLSVSFTIK